MPREPILEAAAARAAAHFDGKAGFKNDQRKNLYQCERNPAHLLVTVDLEPGVTPFLIGCETCTAEGHKGASMKSGFYMIHPLTTPTHEWYRPDSMAGHSSWTRDHLENGGLILRKREVEAPPAG